MRILIFIALLCVAAQGRGQIYIDSYRFGAAFDADAKAFLDSAGITNDTIITAINELVLDLKSYGIWTKMRAIYPMVGGSSTAHRLNLKDPRNLDAAYRLVFNGTWTHTRTGALPGNNTSSFANTYFAPRSGFADSLSMHLSYFSRTQSTANNLIDMGASQTSPTRNISLTSYFGAPYYTFTEMGGTTFVNVTNTTTTGLFIGTRVGSTIKIYRNNSTLTTATQTQSGQPTINIYLGARNDSGIITYPSNKECAFSSIGDGLNDTEAANLNTAVQKFQNTLNRNI